MLFMGEEWGSSSPFQFFTSHPEPDLARATAEGRKREFAEHGWDADEIPDPQDPATYERSKLNWQEIDEGEHGRLRRVYQQLISLRRNEPDLADPWLDNLRVDFDEDRRWIVMERGSLGDCLQPRNRSRRQSRSPARWCWRGMSRPSARRRRRYPVDRLRSSDVLRVK